MDDLALYGGKPAVRTQIKPWNAIDVRDVDAAYEAIKHMAAGNLQTSGFLAGQEHGGQYVQRLEQRWCETFNCKCAVAVNSATSALMCACAAIGVAPEPDSTFVYVPSLSMSATAAVPKFMGANLVWGDINADTFCLDPEYVWNEVPHDVVIVTNLFGMPADLAKWRRYCSKKGVLLIEDNAQAPFAMHANKYAGTWGDIGVFSLNVHKHMQTGEGGIAVTDNAELAHRMRMFRNHGENCVRSETSLSATPEWNIGLNLRMTELIAALALCQLEKGRSAVVGRATLAHKLLTALDQFKHHIKLQGHPGYAYQHSWYAFPIIFYNDRNFWVEALRAEGVPIVSGYGSGPLYKLPAFGDGHVRHPNTEHVHEHLGIIELCAHDPTDEQISQIAEAFRKVAARAP